MPGPLTGYRVVDRIARQQVTIWAAGEDPRMVWAATVESENPSSRDALRRDVAQGLVPALVHGGILPSRDHRRR